MAIRIGDWCCSTGGSPRLKVGGQGGNYSLLNAILSLLTVILLHLEAVLALFPSGPLLMIRKLGERAEAQAAAQE
jgi:hypothetical protein